METLANRVFQINEPQTIAMSKKARELAATGIDVVSLSLGEPDFETPEHIKAAAIAAITNNFSYYTPVAGIPELREAISKKFLEENNLHYAPDQIVVSTGAKHSIMNAIMAIVNPGDEVIIPTPYWVSYSEMVKLAEGVPAFIDAPLDQNYKITAQQLQAAITPKSKAFLFSSPCNPTGSVYSKDELESLVEVFRKHPEIIIISDEIYEYINFSSKHISIGTFAGMENRVITINGLSKGFAMTGWRLGYMGAPKEIAQACEKIQSQFTSATSGITQKAAVAALTGSREPSFKMVEAFRRRKELMLAGLSQIPGIKCNHPDGAFYFFPDISHFLGMHFGSEKIETATDLCMYLLNEGHVSMVTGEAFGNPNCLRISYATSDEKLTMAIERIKNALAKLA
ncbi:MAG: pyridoxal phosphate-dependent aminotransferase [Bacteroidia bacterium]|nr:pyridoxal phosphate-dependent aminotransferase [Bacteroidia bacterium]MCF8425196.1 pyridoxal phosphate-dependent aminotransferase [Bacteroidia bacterium]MCF8447447.1 pyridoxal phosphate-dependent aminotransferase [Bacteroidia bacterium]